MYVSCAGNGFVPASRGQVIERIRHLISPTMPSANLPDTHKVSMGRGIDCRENESACGSDLTL